MDEELERLTPRHHAVMRLVAAGQSNKDAATALGLSQSTVKSYVEDILLMGEEA